MPDETRSYLESGLALWRLPCSAEQIDQLLAYGDLLVDWNANRMNLTRLISPKEIATEHFLDSLSLLTVLDLPPGSRILDVGPGAGFPSLPIKILRPDLHVTLLEATAKKLQFCRAVADALGLEGVTTVHGRAEDTGTLSAIGRFDFVTARAVATLDTLISWCKPYLAGKSGVFAAFKGLRAEHEIVEAEATLCKLGMTAELHQVVVPGSERFHAIILCKNRVRRTSR